MTTVNVRLGLTLQIGEREFFRPEISVDGIDPLLPLEPQLKPALETLEKTFDAASKLLLDKVAEYLKGKK